MKARQICEAWENVESLGRKGYLTSEEQFRKVFNDAVERITGKKLYDPSVREWLERWLATDFEKALVNARSVTTRIFDRPSGGAGHCQMGALALYHAAVFDWLLAKFSISA